MVCSSKLNVEELIFGSRGLSAEDVDLFVIAGYTNQSFQPVTSVTVFSGHTVRCAEQQYLTGRALSSEKWYGSFTALLPAGP